MRIKKHLRVIRSLYRLKKKEQDTSGRRPLVLNLLVNDICNSKCTMCYIWKNKQEKELSPEELSTVLSDELFQGIRHVGITGGEPTLREDLADLFNACMDSLPELRGLSTITNCVKPEMVLARLGEVIELTERRKVPFNIMVSLDGLGAVHDAVRGREGNFDSAMHVISSLTDRIGKDRISIGCTITKDNVWGMHQFLDFLEEKELYGRFRIAEFIVRLYNESASDKIRCFDDEETYELTTLFYRLMTSFEKNETYKRTYGNIIHMLHGGERKISCPYKYDGIVLESRGNIQYCAPKSKVLGNTLQESAKVIWDENMEEKQRILTEECKSCIHDYHAPITYQELKAQEESNYWKSLLCVPAYQKYAKAATPALKLKYKGAKQKSILITGWFGTETVGDKAILGGIINQLRKDYAHHRIIVSTLTLKHIVERTLHELGEEAEVVDCYSADFIRACFYSESVILGGGPLMDMGAMAIPLWAFKLSKAAGGKRIVWGCGLGPLNRDIYKWVTKEILENSSEIMLRDKASTSYAHELSSKINPSTIECPAAGYVRSRDSVTESVFQEHIAVFIREWPHQYYNGSKEKFELERSRMEKGLADLIIKEQKNHSLPVVLYPMHTLHIGGDDRIYARKFIAEHLQGIDATPYSKPTSVSLIMSAMKSSKLNICMRFHSVLFANELKTNFTAIDYTLGGKIFNYLNERDLLDRYVSLNDLITREIEFT